MASGTDQPGPKRRHKKAAGDAVARSMLCVSECMVAMCSYSGAHDVAVAGGVSGSLAESTAERPPCLGTSSIKKAQLSSVPIVTLTAMLCGSARPTPRKRIQHSAPIEDLAGDGVADALHRQDVEPVHDSDMAML